MDVEQFEKDLISTEVTGRGRDDILDAEAMNITTVPTLFINGRRHVGPYDTQSLLRALAAPTDTSHRLVADAVVAPRSTAGVSA